MMLQVQYQQWIIHQHKSSIQLEEIGAVSSV